MLTIDIRSFGFHRSGVPRDESGNAGGYVFDCRALPNPVYDPALAPLCGVHPEIHAFFATHPEVEEFMQHASALVTLSARSFHARAYTHMTITFGCTGGQHRSVYCAERTATHLREIFAGEEVHVTLTHTEEGVWWRR